VSRPIRSNSKTLASELMASSTSRRSM
jgi:hypothetical protein